MPALPDEIEEYRDARWQREGAGRIQTAVQAECFIENVGFASCLTDGAHRRIYEPKFTYLWGLADERFQKERSRNISRLTALCEIARCFLDGAGLTVRGELARVTGLSRPDAGLGNRALVKEGYAEMLGPGIYRKQELELAADYTDYADFKSV